METTNKLPEDFKKKWVAALRSGEYKQNRSKRLYNRSENSYCCLGIAGKLCGVDESSMDDRTDFGTSYRLQAEPPKGFPAILIVSERDDVGDLLSQMNDTGKSFLEIADYIEENL